MDNMTKTSVRRIITVRLAQTARFKYHFDEAYTIKRTAHLKTTSVIVLRPRIQFDFHRSPSLSWRVLLLHVELLRAEWEFLRRGVWKSRISAGGVWERNWARTGSALNGQLLEESEELGSRVGTTLICPAALVLSKRDIPRPQSGKLGHPGKRIEFPTQITASLPPQSVHPANGSGIQSCTTFKRLFGTERPLFIFGQKKIWIFFVCFELRWLGYTRVRQLDSRRFSPCYLVWNIWGLYSMLQKERKILWRTAYGNLRSCIYLLLFSLSCTYDITMCVVRESSPPLLDQN